MGISNLKLGHFFSLIKLGYKSNRVFIKVKKNNFNLAILRLLFIEGYINGFKIEFDQIKIFLKYYDNRPVFNFVNFNKTKNFLKFTKLKWSVNNKKLVYNNSYGLIIYNTNLGLKTFQECLLEKKGGEFFFQLK